MKPGKFSVIAVIIALLFLYVPIVIVMILSFSGSASLNFPPESFGVRWYESFFNNRTWTDGTVTSLQIGLIVALLATVLGVGMAVGMRRGNGFVRAAIGAFALAPLVIPNIVLAVAVYIVFLGWGIVGSPIALILAHTMLAIPYVLVNTIAALSGLDETLVEASNSLGAGSIRTFANITLPLIAPGIIAGAIFAFITSWDEIVVATFLSGPDTRTLPMVMWTSMRTQIDPTIAAAAAMLTITTVLLLVGSSSVTRLLRRPAGPKKGKK